MPRAKGFLLGFDSAVPIIVVKGGGGFGAHGIGVVETDPGDPDYGKIVSAEVSYGGSGYTGTPECNIECVSGYGATATATVAGGVVTGFTITNGGHEYPFPPTAHTHTQAMGRSARTRAQHAACEPWRSHALRTTRWEGWVKLESGSGHFSYNLLHHTDSAHAAQMISYDVEGFIGTATTTAGTGTIELNAALANVRHVPGAPGGNNGGSEDQFVPQFFDELGTGGDDGNLLRRKLQQMFYSQTDPSIVFDGDGYPVGSFTATLVSRVIEYDGEGSGEEHETRNELVTTTASGTMNFCAEVRIGIPVEFEGGIRLPITVTGAIVCVVTSGTIPPVGAGPYSRLPVFLFADGFEDISRISHSFGDKTSLTLETPNWVTGTGWLSTSLTKIKGSWVPDFYGETDFDDINENFPAFTLLFRPIDTLPWGAALSNRRLDTSTNKIWNPNGTAALDPLTH